jgi:hypothetical protein
MKYFFYKHNEIFLWSNQNKWNISSISTMKYFCDQIKTNEIFLPQTYWNYNISFTYFKEIRFVQQDKHSYCFSPLSTIYIREDFSSFHYLYSWWKIYDDTKTYWMGITHLSSTTVVLILWKLGTWRSRQSIMMGKCMK